MHLYWFLQKKSRKFMVCTKFKKKTGRLNIFVVRAIGSDDTIASRQCDRDEATATKARAKGDDVVDSYI